MNVFHRVALSSLKRNRTRTIVTIIGIILSTAMISAVTTFASSIRNFAIQDIIHSEGNWHGSVTDEKISTFKSVKDSDKTECAVYLQRLGYAAAEGCQNEFKPYIYLLGAGKGVKDLLPIHITSGSYPKASDEILLPDHLYSNGGVKHRIGEKLTLELGQRLYDGNVMSQDNACYVQSPNGIVFNGETLEVSEARTYTVVGFYERLPWTLEDISAPGYTAITIADSELTDDIHCDIYWRMKDPDEIYDFMSKNKLEGKTNSNLLMLLGTLAFTSFLQMLYGLCAIVIGLIMLGSIALIYNAFSISVSERTKQFGLLSSIGATKKQLRKMVLFEAFVVSGIGIPIGILSGIGGIGVTLLLLGSKFRSIGFSGDLTLSVSPASLIIAAAVALLTVLISAYIPSKRATKVTAVEAIRQNQDIKNKTVKTSKLTHRLFGLPGILASKYYKLNRKKYRATVISLFMSIVLFVSASAFTEYLMQTASGSFESVGYDLIYESPSQFRKSISPDDLLESIRSAKSVTSAVYSKERYEKVRIKNEYLTQKGIRLLNKDNSNDAVKYMYVHIIFIDDRTFDGLLKKYDLSEKKFKNSKQPLAIATDGSININIKTMKYENQRYYNQQEFEIETLLKKEIDGYRLYGIDSNENGESIYRYIKIGSQEQEDEFIELTQDQATQAKQLMVGSVITQKPNFIKNLDMPTLIYPISLVNAVFDKADQESAYVDYYTITSDDHSQSFTAIKAILSEKGLDQENLFDITQGVESKRNFVTIIRVFSYGFIILISMIAAANVFNTISTNIHLRRREFAMLKSVGMTRKGFNKMMNFECLLYGSKALILGIPCSCVVTYLIYRSILSGYETTFMLPWAAMGIAALSVFLVVFVTMIYSMSKIKKDNPIDALKNEAI